MRNSGHFAACLLLAAVAALALRLPRLEQRPMHTDEAVHAVKLDELLQSGRYDYDPDDFHGPVLYYTTWPVLRLCRAPSLADMTEGMLRIVPVLFGTGLILLLVLVADGLGRPAAAVAGGLTAVSPALVYYSRYYIQEMLLLFFLFLAVGAGWRYVRSRKVIWALPAGLALGLAQATKETWILSAAALALAAAVTIRRTPSFQANDTRPRSLPRWPWVAAGILALAVSACCLSGLFANPAALGKALAALPGYIGQAADHGIHRHPPLYYLGRLLLVHDAPGPWWSEAFIVLLAATGLGLAWKRPELPGAHPAFARFLAVYAVGLTVLYALIPYKTPWCLIQFLHPLMLLAGLGTVGLIRGLRNVMPARVRTSATAAACALLLLGTVHLARQAQAATGRYSADNRNPYAYAHPVSDIQHLATTVERIAAATPDGRNLLIRVVTPDPWPLPWYLRRFTHVGYWETVPDKTDAPLVIAATEFSEELAARMQGDYQVSHFGQRPGAVLLLYVERSLWQKFSAGLTPATQASAEPTGP